VKFDNFGPRRAVRFDSYTDPLGKAGGQGCSWQYEGQEAADQLEYEAENQFHVSRAVRLLVQLTQELLEAYSHGAELPELNGRISDAEMANTAHWWMRERLRSLVRFDFSQRFSGSELPRFD
jgi:hypothetical protein